MRNVKPFIEPQALAGEWATLPKTGESIAGMGRSLIFRLCQSGEIRSALLRRPGCTRGLRMVHVPSVHTYVAKVAAAQQAELDRAINKDTANTSTAAA